MLMEVDSPLAKIPPILRKNFEQLCSGNVGLFPFSWNDINHIREYTEDNSTYTYHYSFTIRYSTMVLEWDLVFHPDDLSRAPDLNLKNESLSQAVECDLPLLLDSWDVENANSLIKLICNIHSYYKSLHRTQFGNGPIYSHIFKEYNSFREATDIPEDNIEVYVDDTSIHFAIYFEPDDSELPGKLIPWSSEYATLMKSENEGYLLMISMWDLFGSNVNTASLELSAHLKTYLTDETKNWQLPYYSTSLTLVEYYNLIKRTLQCLIEKIVQSYLKATGIDPISYINEKCLLDIPPQLRLQFERLCCRNIGLFPCDTNEIVHYKKYHEDNSSYTYYFILRIRFATKVLLWALIFDPEDMFFAPDLNFFNNKFTISLEVSTLLRKVEALQKWDLNNSLSLVEFIQQFYIVYRKYSKNLLKNDKRYRGLFAEYDFLIKHHIKKDDVQIFMDSKGVHFSISLILNAPVLPEYPQPMKLESLLNPGPQDLDNSVLTVSFPGLDRSNVQTSLQLSPRFHKCLNLPTLVKLRYYEEWESLTDYSLWVTSLLQHHVERAQKIYAKKLEFITHLFCMFPQFVLEYDAVTFSNAHLLCELGGYFVPVSIKLEDNFPEGRPVVALTSIYCQKGCFRYVFNYEYYPFWPAKKMWESIMIGIKIEMQEYREHNFCGRS